MWEAPPGGAGRGVLFSLTAWCSLGRDLGDGGAGGGLVDDALVGGEGGQQGLQGEVVDRAGVAAAGLVDQRDGVVCEQGVGASGQVQVVGWTWPSWSSWAGVGSGRS